MTLFCYFVINIVIVILIFEVVHIGVNYCQEKFNWQFLLFLITLYLESYPLANPWVSLALGISDVSSRNKIVRKGCNE